MLKREYEILLSELESNNLIVELFPAPEQKHHCHYIRVAVEKNVYWYRELFAQNPSVRKQDLIRILKRLIEGKKVNSKWLDFINKKAEEIFEPF